MPGEYSLSGNCAVMKEISELVAKALEIFGSRGELVVRPYIRIEHREIPGGKL